MKLIVTIGDEGTPKKQWQLCGEVEDIWGLMCSGNIVFAQAKDPDYHFYVQMFLQSAAEKTQVDIASRKRNVPEASCLKTAPIHNMRAENLFAHQSYAEQSTRAGHNRLRGLGLSKASSTFALESKLRSNRRKRFLKMVKRSKAQLSDWKVNPNSNQLSPCLAYP
jgi:hypothetical protein